MAKAEYRSAVRSRRLITAALADLLQEKPLDKITVTDVVRRADINRGTFYAHYTDIPDVLHSMVEQYFSQFQEALSGEPHRLDEIPGIVVRQIQHLLEEDQDFVNKVVDSSASSLLQEQLCDVLLDYLLAQEEVFSTVSHEEYVFKLRFCAGGLSRLYRDWLSGRLPFSLDELTRQAEIMLTHIMTEVNIQ